MKARNPLITDQYEKGRTSIRSLVAFHFGSGVYRFVLDNEPREWPIGSGDIWQPGAIIKINGFANNIGFSASTFDIILAASPDDGLTPEVLKTIYQEDFMGRLVEIFELHINPDTGVGVGVDLIGRPFIEGLKPVNDPSIGYHLKMRCITKSIDFSKKNGRIATNEDQLKRDPNDPFFEASATVGQVQVPWGRNKV